MRRLGLAALSLLLLLGALQGCGGGEEQSSSTAPTDQGQTKASAQSPRERAEALIKAKAKETGQKRENSEEPSSNPTVPTRHVPIAEPQPGSEAPAPGVPTTKGGDNSIQAFGTEGEQDPREEAISNLLAYREARLSGEWDRACALASEEFREQLEVLIDNAKAKGEAPKPKGCGETLALFTPDQAKAALREKFQISEVLSFRVEEPYAYLIFKGQEGKVMFIAMNDEDGSWRVNVPEPEGFGVGG